MQSRLQPRTTSALLSLALLAAFPAFAQVAPAPAYDAATIAKYDADRDGRLDEAERRQLEADRPMVAAAPAAAGRSAAENDVVTMSPFEVKAETRGYLASNSLSGTRINSRLEDLGASISVVTKQQLQDLAAVDINDIFLTEASTEGTYQWTSTSAVTASGTTYHVDETGVNPQTANRIRGLAAANIARGNFASTSSIPLDTYNIDAVEISRGPNSNIFGLGDAAGTVNVITSRANLSRESTNVSLRGDSYGGWRTSLSLNRPLVKNAVAIRLDAMHEEKGFIRQPAHDVTSRLQGSVTVRPFKNTTIRGSIESFRNHNTRANTLTPRDQVTFWLANGAATYDPVAAQIHVNGAVVTSNPAIVTSPSSQFLNRPSTYIDHGRIIFYSVNRQSANINSGTPSPGNTSGSARYAQIGFPNIPLFSVLPGISNRDLYDWEEINIAGANYDQMKAETYQLEIEQFFLQTGKHLLALQAGVYREDSDRVSRNWVGQPDGVAVSPQIDINERRLDGSPNPFFLRPYIGGTEPQIFTRPETNDNMRATLAYEANFTGEKNWQRWLGRQRFAGYGEFRMVVNGTLRSRDLIVDDHAWSNLTSRSQTYTRQYPRYYIGDADGFDVDYAPERLNPNHGPATLRWYNGLTRQWVDEPVVIGESWFTGGLVKRQQRTKGLVWQGFLLNDRIVPTFGYRSDKSRTRTTPGQPFIDPATGLGNLGQVDRFSGPWNEKRGNTRTKGVVVKPLRWLNLHYNESDSFLPADTQQNLFGELLPNPTGTGKDYGFTLNLWDGKLVARVNKYESMQHDSRSGIATATRRLHRLDFDVGPDDTFDLEEQIDLWLTPTIPDATQRRTEVLRRMQLSEDFITMIRGAGALGVNDVNDALSKGVEIELNFNPSRYWTLKLTGAQQKAIDSKISRTGVNWIHHRLPVWKSIEAPGANGVFENGAPGAPGSDDVYWWTQNTNPDTPISNDVNIPANWLEVNYWRDYRIAAATEGKPKSQVREWRFSATTSYSLAGLTSHRHLRNLTVGGTVRWEDQASIGFGWGQPDADGVIRTLDVDKKYWDKARTYADLMARYRFRMFHDRITCSLQLNVRNALESGRLQVVSVNPDGTPANYRIVDPRQFILSASFDL